MYVEIIFQKINKKNTNRLRPRYYYYLRFGTEECRLAPTTDNLESGLFVKTQ